jgi:hypothetical protein
MMNENRIRERIREMRALIRIGKERLARHSPVWAVYLASETLRSLSDVLDDLDGETGAEAPAGEERRVRRAV